MAFPLDAATFADRKNMKAPGAGGVHLLKYIWTLLKASLIFFSEKFIPRFYLMTYTLNSCGNVIMYIKMSLDNNIYLKISYTVYENKVFPNKLFYCSKM